MFSEVMSVEVSSNGVDFAMFPTRYSGPQGPLVPLDFAISIYFGVEMKSEYARPSTETVRLAKKINSGLSL